ncbi:hypothetical protein PVAND_008117 [Polypedilum vanderplanki]|uniref:4-hydroxybenzoate polyprenyltransferase, mitochondrial n=1 Tax=Polypedilum vanderplanki TaxID=319348 RepID=A0A9J6C8H2_POLVA|nr:hypothetical protein PVAND_008117 [Polypedilum vanderplanki]
MLLRLKSSRLIDTRTWKKVLNYNLNYTTLEIPKITFISSSSFSTCKNINYSPIKQNEANTVTKNIVKDYFEKFRSSPYVRIMRLDRPIGSLLLYWPCSWSIAVAAQPGCIPDLYMLALFASGAIIMRGAGCTINDMWDKNIDAKVQRTSTRPLVTGEMTHLDAWFFLGAQLGLGLLILLELNWNAILLGASSLGLVIVYPLMKRITNWPQFVLGMTFNWGALLGFCAIHGDVNWAACLPLYTAGICWTIIYDTIYAHQDRVDDLIVGVKSTALRFGRDTKKWLTCFAVLMNSSLITTGLVCDLTWPYYASISVIAAHIGQQIYTLNIDDPNDCAKKFLSNNHVGLILFLGIVIGVFLQNPDTTKNKDTTKILQSLNSNHVVQLEGK